MISDLLEKLISRLAAWLFARAAEYFQKRKEQSDSDAAIDARLKAVKDAYMQAFDGHPVTPEQRAALKSAISNFLRGPDGGL